MSGEVKLVSNANLEAAPQTAGMTRREAFASDNVWVGEVRTEPGAVSGWHEHGEHTTYVHIISGAAKLEFGPGGKTVLEAKPGDFVVIPPHTIHRESNPGDLEQVIVVVRLGTGPTVTNVDGPQEG